MDHAESFGAIISEPPMNEVVTSPLAEGIEAVRSRGVVPTYELTELLRNEESQRAVLYVPKEWIPTRPSAYRQAFKDAWWATLPQPDHRADFVDGDIGDLYSGEPQPQVVKAAHLSPWLLERNIITQQDIQFIYQGTNSDVVRSSFDDTRPGAVIASNNTHADSSEERRTWLSARNEDARTRRVALEVNSHEDIEAFMHGQNSFDTQVVLRAIARMGRKGRAIDEYLPWMQRQLESESNSVRNRGVTALRHLFHAGVITRDVLDETGVDIPRLTGPLSENVKEFTPAFAQMVEKLQAHPVLSEMIYPLLIVAGSRLKGYAQDGISDMDLSVCIKPGVHQAEIMRKGLQEIFGKDLPNELWLEQTPDGLHIIDTENGTDDGWSHLVHNAVWVGTDQQMHMVRQELAKAYEENGNLRTIALRRLEQDALQYRLLHKGYERHYAVRADDQHIHRDAIDSQSTFWDPGYRRMATQLFAEKVRLPYIK